MSVAFPSVCGELIQDGAVDMLNSGLLAWLSCEQLWLLSVPISCQAEEMETFNYNL